MDPPLLPTSTLNCSSPAASWSSGCSAASTLGDNDRNVDAESATLVSAILARDTERVRLLLDAGVVLIKPDTWVLYEACLCGLEMLHLLLFDSDIDFNCPVPQENGEIILHFVLRTPRERFRDDKEDIVKLLLRTGANPFLPDRLGDTAIHFLAGDTRTAGSSTEGYRLLRLLLEDCPELRERCSEYINSKNNFNDTPLVIAVLYHNIECVQLLLDHGADPFEPGEFGMNALDFAAQREYSSIVRLLLDHITKHEGEERESAENKTLEMDHGSPC